nr:FAD-binding oxidoreductase [uncultured Hyphomonas sp.]
MKLSGWGRYPTVECETGSPRSEADLEELVRSGPVIARGNGRSYGDSSLNSHMTIDMRRMSRMLSFDEANGQLTAEAGVLLADIISTFLPRGWFPAVTPGTKFVTVGGMIAADVHGKNHHKDGAFSSFLDWIDILGSDGDIRRCSREENPDLFEWTIGGMGLTGIILRAAFRLRPVESGWIRQTTIPAENLAAAIDIFERSADSTYSVAWIDCLSTGASLGRSLVYLGEHAAHADLPRKQLQAPFQTPRKRKLTVPLDAPGFALNRWTVKAFNEVYYRAGRSKTGTQLVDWDTYFYPLDAILKWNRIYGRKGFAQFQCVIPLEQSKEGMQALLEAISAAGQGSFLSVLKRFGAQESRFSFPMEGYTLALDFPVNRRSLDLMNRLDEITIAHGGRFYLAKDSRLKAETLAKSDERVSDFREMRKSTSAAETFSSAQSDRLVL